MTKAGKRDRRRSLYGWLLWLPVLGVIFTPLFFDAWLNIASRNLDYELCRLNTRLGDLNASLDASRVEAARLEAVDRLFCAAPDLGLVEPEPHQVVRLRRNGEYPRATPPAFPIFVAEEQRISEEDAGGWPLDGEDAAEGLLAALPQEHPGLVVEPVDSAVQQLEPLPESSDPPIALPDSSVSGEASSRGRASRGNMALDASLPNLLGRL